MKTDTASVAGDPTRVGIVPFAGGLLGRRGPSPAWPAYGRSDNRCVTQSDDVLSGPT